MDKLITNTFWSQQLMQIKEGGFTVVWRKVGKALQFPFRLMGFFLATQFLKNMEENPVPTIAEVIDMYNTLKSGVYGIQLAEETAIGEYPRECLDLIDELTKEVSNEKK